MAFTIVALQAHPDIDVLLSGGMLAGAASRGHRVIVVTASGGGTRRVREQDLWHANQALGVHQVLPLGCDLSAPDVEVPAIHLASLIEAAGADAVVGYARGTPSGDRNSVRAHLVTRRACDLAQTPVLLESRLPNRSRGVRRHLILRSLRGLPIRSRPVGEVSGFLHVVHVESFVAAKLTAWGMLMPSRATGGPQLRTVESLLALPAPWSRLGLSREWYDEARRAPLDNPDDDVVTDLL